jgi:hypothetical protein
MFSNESVTDENRVWANMALHVAVVAKCQDNICEEEIFFEMMVEDENDSFSSDSKKEPKDSISDGKQNSSVINVVGFSIKRKHGGSSSDSDSVSSRSSMSSSELKKNEEKRVMWAKVAAHVAYIAEYQDDFCEEEMYFEMMEVNSSSDSDSVSEKPIADYCQKSPSDSDSVSSTQII